MLAVLHHASLNGEMFASNRFMRSRIRLGDACVLTRRHRLPRSMPSKFPVSDRQRGDHMRPGREMITMALAVEKENVMTG
jgi:hypothetical protein